MLAGKDINLTGQNVTIESADNTYNAQEKHEYKKSGLTVSLGTPALSVAESVHDTIKKADSVKDDRLKSADRWQRNKRLDQKRKRQRFESN